jgi:putative transposase
MPEYRRNRVSGGTYFFTVNLNDRRSGLLVSHIDHLRAAVGRARELKPFHIDAWVVLPDHMHAVWTLPAGDSDFSQRWRTIKMAFSKAIDPMETLSTSRRVRGERGIWQRRFWEHTVRDESDYRAHIDYIHFNPVKHGFVSSVAEWPFSTFHRAVARGDYPSSWAFDDPDDAPRGERE